MSGEGRAERRAVAWIGRSGAVMLAVFVLAQFGSLSSVLGYEYAVLTGALMGSVGVVRCIARGAPSARIWARAEADALDLLAWVGIGTALSLLNMLRVKNCEPLVGLAFMATFGVGAIPVSVATAAFVRALTEGRRRWLLLGALWGCSAAGTLAYVALQPDITAYDTFFGYFAGSIYDESLVGFSAHIWYRAAGLCWAALVLGLLALRLEPSRFHRRVVVLAALGFIGIHAQRGDLGLVKTRAYVEAELGGFVETEHFDLYYDASHFDAERLAQLVYDHEARHAELAEFWGHEPDRRLRSYVYGDRDEKGRLMGGRRTLVAKIWLGEMHITWSGVGNTLLAHEMAHLFLKEDGTGPLDLSTAFGVVPLMAMVEGAATAAGWGGGEWDEHTWSAAMQREGVADDLADILGPFGFWSKYSHRAYTLTGSFVRYLIDTRGAEPFRVAYGHGDFEGVYGESLDALTDEWEAWLAELELAEEVQTTARWHFDRPSIFGRRCARSIATRMDAGDVFVRQGRREEAIRCFEDVVVDDPTNVRLRLDVARRLVRLEAESEARSHAEFVRDLPGAGLRASAAADELLADMAWRAGEQSAASETYARLAEGAGTESDRRRLLAKAAGAGAEGPLTERALRLALVAEPAEPRENQVADLLEAARAEGSELARYLALLRMAGSPHSLTASPEWERLDMSALSPPHARNVLRLRALSLALAGESQRSCAAWDDVARAALPGSSFAAEADMWRGRCARGTMPPA